MENSFSPHRIKTPCSSGCLSSHPILMTAAIALTVGLPASAMADNIAPRGAGIMGINAAVDDSPGTPLYHAGVAANINDDDLGTSVDNYSDGNDQGQAVSCVGVVWPTLRYEQISSLNLTLAAFYDGGWFGATNSGPGAGGTLTADYLVEPTLQVTDAFTNAQRFYRVVTAF